MERGFLWYVKKAFLLKWNLLAVGAAVVAGVISGYPEAVIPVAMGLEVLYLAALSSNGRFQDAMRAQEHELTSAFAAASSGQKRDRMLASLQPRDRSSFERLKEQCATLRQIAREVKGAQGADPVLDVDYQSEGMNRLLWIYLRLLYSKNAIERFFETIDRSGIEEDMAHAAQRLAALGDPADDSPNDTRRRASLEDHVRTCEVRLANHARAADNYEFIKDEIARLSSKIASLAEMAVNRQDTSFISSEVDIVSESVASSEKAMSELDFLTGWTAGDEAAPDLLEGKGEVEQAG
jgi:hypothetical protein